MVDNFTAGEYESLIIAAKRLQSFTADMPDVARIADAFLEFEANFRALAEMIVPELEQIAAHMPQDWKAAERERSRKDVERKRRELRGRK